MTEATPEQIVAFLTGAPAMTDEERQRFSRRLREAAEENERLRYALQEIASHESGEEDGIDYLATVACRALEPSGKS